MAQNLTRLTKSIRNIEKPRPLKLTSGQNRLVVNEGRITTADDVMTLVDTVSMHILNGNYDKVLQANTLSLCANLKVYGQQLEAVYKDQLDRAFIIFRNGTRDDKLDNNSRTHLLEIIELRANSWVLCDNINNYYKSKYSTIDGFLASQTDNISVDASNIPGSMAFVGPTTPTPPPALTQILQPGEVIKTSGKFAKPTKIPGKNYCKDEVVIRNSDSGKVNPGAKERLVQITGPAEEKINYAKQLMEDTIRRNASPVRLEQTEKERVGGSSSSLNSSASDDSNRLNLGMNRAKLLHSLSTNDATLGEYKYTVTVGNHSVKITGTNLDLVRTSKLILDEYFSGEPDQYLGGGDYFSNFQSDPTPALGTTTNFALTGRVESVDSGATSESEETYKATSSGSTQISSEMTRDSSHYSDNSSQKGQSDEDKLNTSSDLVQYKRDTLLQLALSSFSAATPPDWEKVSRDFPIIIKKVAELFDPAVYSQKWLETEVHSIICATEVDLADQE